VSSEGHRRQNDEDDEGDQGVNPARKPMANGHDDVDFENEHKDDKQEKEWHILPPP